MKTMCRMAIPVALMTLSLFGGNGSDGTGEYWEDGSGVKHYYLYQNALSSGTYWGGNAYSYTRADAQAATGSQPWINGSVWVFERNAPHTGWSSFGGERQYYGLIIERPCLSDSFRMEGGCVMTFGALGIHSDVSDTNLRFYHNGSAAKIVLAESQTWSGPAAGTLSSAPFVIIPNYTYSGAYSNRVAAAENVVWTIEGDTFLALHTYTNELDAADVVIKAPAIVSIPQHWYGLGCLGARTLTIDGGTGLYFGANLSLDPGTVGSGTWGIGSYPLISPGQVARTIALKNGATLTALAATTVTGGVTVVAADTSVTALSGTFVLADSETVFRIDAGATLDLTGATFTGTGACAFEGCGTLRLDCTAAGSDDLLFLRDAALSGFSGDIVVAGGTLVLESGASIPAGQTVTTEGTGNLLVIDPDDFDPNVQMGGTKALATHPLLISDVAVPSGPLQVGAGETLHVFGNGLGAASALTLDEGSTLLFHRTATIAAPVTSKGSVSFQTADHSVTGTLAGVYTAAATNAATVVIDSPGLIDFAGGGTIGVHATDSSRTEILQMNSGHATLTGEFVAQASLDVVGGLLTIRDGGRWLVSKQWKYLWINKNTARAACLEIGPDGLFEFVSGNCSAVIGKTTPSAFESKLLVNGGTYRHLYDKITLAADGVIEIADGLFTTARRITCTDTNGTARVVLGNGTYQARSGDYCTVMFDGDGACTVSVEGHATLDLSNRPATMNDSDNAIAPCTWTCAGEARLAVLGRSDAVSVVTLHNFEADGLAFDLNPMAVKVVVAGPKDPVGIGWVLPGATGSVVAASGTAPGLVASFVVPQGVTLDVAALPAAWHEGFTFSAVSNLTFDADATLRFPYFGSAYAFEIAGALTLPETMNYWVAAAGPREPVVAAPVLVPAAGLTGTNCVWTCLGGVRSSGASLQAAEGVLAFSDTMRGSVFTLR